MKKSGFLQDKNSSMISSRLALEEALRSGARKMVLEAIKNAEAE